MVTERGGLPWPAGDSSGGSAWEMGSAQRALLTPYLLCLHQPESKAGRSERLLNRRGDPDRGHAGTRVSCALWELRQPNEGTCVGQEAPSWLCWASPPESPVWG